MQPDLAASKKPYIITIDNLHPPETRSTERGRVGQQDSFVVIPSNTANNIKVGNTHVVELQREAREEEIKHERNKAAWYERQERIEENELLEEPPPRLQNILRTPNNFNAATSTPLLDASTRLPLNPRTVTPVAHIPTAILSGSSLDRSHLPQPHQSVLGRTLPPRSNHSSVPAQRPTAAAVPAPVRASVSAPQSSTPPNSAALRGGAPALGEFARTPSSMEPPRMTNVAVDRPGASVASSVFYARPRLTAPTSTRLNASRKPGASDRQSAHSTREAPQTYLKLLRPPPAYAALGLELDRQEKAKRQREAEREDPALRGGTSALSGVAAVDIDGVKARRVREAIEAALAERMTNAPGHAKGQPAFILDGDATQRKTPVFSFPASPATSSLAANSGGKMRSMSAALATHSASFTPSTSQTQVESAPVARSRNPFRKRVVSYPDMPEFGDTRTNTVAPSVVTPLKTIKAPSNAIVAAKAAAKSNAAPSVPLKREPSMEKARVSTSKPNVSAKDICPPANANTKPKPLIPISAVKVPILPEDVRQEALRRDAQELVSMPRKRSGSEDDREDNDEDDSVDRQPPLKKRTIVNGRGSTSSVASSKGKAKGKEEKTKVFDWKGWGKKD
ncbi:hypothetical protein HYPSUDRAFT_52197 [Hypholoma sublateritium FD-334 SS-4]|uniref:Uncharacterized protein n=1 Tax=Hypholoma sublateritium (strain FD-334 SS-4) TaxID=945553 RepID=A0A0D2LHY7_HYPSF|nr:hypothetical protein HYPSUDRAFT_52197 [Hypholoma sublateritium FD-334 SS-4]